jgi:hypothetical protein
MTTLGIRRPPPRSDVPYVGSIRTRNAIFLSCTIAKFMWTAVRELLSCSWNPSCLSHVARLLHTCVGETKQFFWICNAALCWTLWNVRNKFSVEGKFPTQPIDCIYKISMYLQVWKPMPRRSDREALELTIGRIHALHASVWDRQEVTTSAAIS